MLTDQQQRIRGKMIKLSEIEPEFYNRVFNQGCRGNKKMKIYEFQWCNKADKEWVSARTMIEAIQTYLKSSGVAIFDLDPLYDDIVEMSMCDCKEIKFIDSKDGQEKSLSRWLIDNPDKSEIVCGTMY